MNKWYCVKSEIGKNGSGKIDPYIDWAFGAGRAPHVVDPSDRFPLLVLLQKDLSIEAFASGDFFPDGARPPDWCTMVRVPAIYRSGYPLCRPGYFTALVTSKFFDLFQGGRTAPALFDNILRMAVSRNLLKATFPPHAADARSQPPPTPSGSGEAGTVVVGIIDDGIGFANERFRTAEGRSRVEYVWLQDGAYNSDAACYGYGRSFSRCGERGIDALLKSATHSGLIDEDEVYVETGAFDFGRDPGPTFRTAALHASHGTHVMDLACGYDPHAAPKTAKGEDARPIVCVQLPAATDEGTSGASLDTFVIDGLHYILDKADDIARGRGCGRLPVVVNFSYGTIAGRHDGTSDIERAIDDLIVARGRTGAPLRVVMPAGNSRLRKCHAGFSFKDKATETRCGSTVELFWRVIPDDRTATHLEVWLPKSRQNSPVKLSVQPPGGDPSPPLCDDVGTVLVWGKSRKEGLCEVRYSYVPRPTDCGMFLISLRPTELTDEDKVEPTAPAGVWTVILENVSLEPEDVVHAWIQRDDTRYGYVTLGRQSYFDHAEYEEPIEDSPFPAADKDECVVKRAGTLNSIATGCQTIVIGGFRRSDMTVAEYSGEGPTRASHRLGPDALAPSDDSVAHRGILAAGNRSGSVEALIGTSVATAAVTRMVGDLLADGVLADRGVVQAVAAAEEAGAANQRPPLPREEIAGWGRLDRPDVRPVHRIDATD